MNLIGWQKIEFLRASCWAFDSTPDQKLTDLCIISHRKLGRNGEKCFLLPYSRASEVPGLQDSAEGQLDSLWGTASRQVTPLSLHPHLSTKKQILPCLRGQFGDSAFQSVAVRMCRPRGNTCSLRKVLPSPPLTNRACGSNNPCPPTARLTQHPQEAASAEPLQGLTRF